MAKKALSPLKKDLFYVILAPILKIFECAFELIVPLLVKSVIDYLVGDKRALFTNELYETDPNPLKSIFFPCLIMFALAFAGFAITMITQYLAAKIATKYSKELRDNIYSQSQRISSRQLEEFGSSKVLNLISNDSLAMQSGVNLFMRLFARAPFLIIGSIIASFLVSLTAGLIVLSSLLLSFAVGAIVMLLSPRKYASVQSKLDELSTKSNDTLEGARPIRAFNKQEDEYASFTSHSEEYRKKSFSLFKLNSILNPLTFLFIDAGILLIVYFVAQSGNKLINVGSAVAVISYLTQSLAAFIMFSKLVVSLTRANTSRKRIDSFLSIEPDIVSGEKKEKEGKNIFTIKGAYLSYGGSEYALKNISFSLNEGESVGLIGGTGSGKSSLISLLERFIDADKGEIYFYNQNIKDVSLSSIREEIAYISQKPQLYKGSIRSNLLLAKADANEEEMKEALRKADCLAFVEGYEDGLDHEVEEGGKNYSGGQRQRLLIAKAILSNRKILILDDATSALDYKTDSFVRGEIKKLNKTNIIISQRATSVRNCDKIYVFDNGEIIASGKHDELLANCSLYKEIYETQVAVK